MMIKLDKLNELLGNDKKIVGRFLDLYLEKVPQLISRLATQLEQNDNEGAGVTAHEIKSQSGYLGLDEVVRIAAEIEDAADNKGMADYNTLYRQLEIELSAAMAELQKII